MFEILDSHRVDITRVEGLYCVCGYKLSIREELAGHHAAMLEQRGLLRPEIDYSMVERAFTKVYPHGGSTYRRFDRITQEQADQDVRDHIRRVLQAALGGEQA